MFLRCLLLNLQAPDFLQISTGSVDSCVVVGSEGVCELGHGPLLFVGLPGHTKTFSTCTGVGETGQTWLLSILHIYSWQKSINSFYFSISRSDNTPTHSKERKEHSNHQQLIHGVTSV